MTDGDDKVTRRYRELPAEEPPAALDAAIRDAAHRAVAPKRGAQRWAVPVSLAAVLVLAVGVTLRMQQEVPGIETAPPQNEYSAPPPAAEPEPPAKPPAMAAPPPPEVGATSRMSQAKPAEPAMDKAAATPPVQKLKKDQQAARESDQRDLRSDPAPAAVEEKRAFAESPSVPAAPPAPAARAAPSPLVREREESPRPEALRAQTVPLAKTEAARAAGNVAAPQAPAAAMAPSPPVAQSRAKSEVSADDAKETARGPRERELDRIAQLRREGKHAEADEALAKFRRDHPDYRIPEAIWEQVKPR